jgi:hypothetical protein
MEGSRTSSRRRRVHALSLHLNQGKWRDWRASSRQRRMGLVREGVSKIYPWRDQILSGNPGKASGCFTRITMVSVFWIRVFMRAQQSLWDRT